MSREALDPLWPTFTPDPESKWAMGEDLVYYDGPIIAIWHKDGDVQKYFGVSCDTLERAPRDWLERWLVGPLTLDPDTATVYDLLTSSGKVIALDHYHADGEIKAHFPIEVSTLHPELLPEPGFPLFHLTKGCPCGDP